jgi:hypothetical protein
MMAHWRKWVAGAVGAVLALAALVYAANATSGGTYYGALLIFATGVLFAFLQIKRGFDQANAARHAGAAEPAAEAQSAPAQSTAGPRRTTNGSGQPVAGQAAGDTRAAQQASGAPAGQTNGSGAKT